MLSRTLLATSRAFSAGSRCCILKHQQQRVSMFDPRKQQQRSVAAAAAGGGGGGIRQMTPQELQELLRDDAAAEGVQFVDVREPAERDLAALPRFQLFPLSQAARWADTIEDDLDATKPTVVLCHHGVRSMQMSAFLLSKGFEDVANVTGGIHAYSIGVDPNVPTY